MTPIQSALLFGLLLGGASATAIVWNLARAHYRPEWGAFEALRRERDFNARELFAERIKNEQLERQLSRRLFRVGS